MCDVACGSLTDEAEIRDAIRRVPAGGTVVIAAGTYELHADVPPYQCRAAPAPWRDVGAGR
jgi:hypothetical protein